MQLDQNQFTGWTLAQAEELNIERENMIMQVDFYYAS
jgi:hypothetical protein